MQTTHRRTLFILPVLALLAVPACSIFNRAPTIQNFPPPEAPSAAAPIEFDDSACPLESGTATCAPESELGALGCRQLRLAGDVMAGLQPAHPLRVCLTGGPGQPIPSQFLYREGCLLPQYIRYVIQEDGEYRLIDSVEEMQRAYAPIESETEALSYALAVSGLGVRYGLEPEAGLRYFVDEMQDTHVLRSERGYRVHLYDYKVCGCGPHATTAVDLLVTFDGQVEEEQRVKVFEDPAEDELCVD